MRLTREHYQLSHIDIEAVYGYRKLPHTRMRLVPGAHLSSLADTYADVLNKSSNS